MTIEFNSSHPDETNYLGRLLGMMLRAGDLVTLSGSLGAGKTHLVRGLATGAGIDPMQVSSPTFVIAQEYTAVRPGRPLLVHIDAYRLKHGDELDAIGFDEMRDASRNGDLAPAPIVVVEWPENVEDAITTPDVAITIEPGPGELSRHIAVESPSDESRESLIERLKLVFSRMNSKPDSNRPHSHRPHDQSPHGPQG